MNSELSINLFSQGFCTSLPVCHRATPPREAKKTRIILSKKCSSVKLLIGRDINNGDQYSREENILLYGRNGTVQTYGVPMSLISTTCCTGSVFLKDACYHSLLNNILLAFLHCKMHQFHQTFHNVRS